MGITTSKYTRISSLVAMSFCTGIMAFSSAHAATDRKILSSAFCQGTTNAGRPLLRYNGSSLRASGADVTVVCPILRDNTSGGLLEFRVTFKKSSRSDSRRADVQFFSCNGDFGGGCESRTKRTTSSNHEFTSAAPTRSELASLPHGDKHYYYLRTVLPDGWSIVFIRYTEE